MTRAVLTDTLRLSEADRDALVRALNNVPNTDPEKAKRKSDRYSYYVPEGISVEFLPEGKSAGMFLVAPRNLSIGGVAFLHRQFVYQGVTCVVHLKARDGQTAEVRGEVARCRCIKGRIHEIGVAFRAPIDLGSFVQRKLPLGVGGGPSYRAVDLAGLARRLENQAMAQAPLEEVRATVRDMACGVRRLGAQTPREPGAAATPST